MTDLSNTGIPQGRGKEWWKSLSPSQKNAVVIPLLDAGESNTKISSKLDISKNSVVRIRQDENRRKYPEHYDAYGNSLHLATRRPAPPKSKPADTGLQKKRQQAPELRSAPVKISGRALADSVVIPPIELDLSPAGLAPHLFCAPPYREEDKNR